MLTFHRLHRGPCLLAGRLSFTWACLAAMCRSCKLATHCLQCSLPAKPVLSAVTCCTTTSWRKAECFDVHHPSLSIMLAYFSHTAEQRHCCKCYCMLPDICVAMWLGKSTCHADRLGLLCTCECPLHAGGIALNATAWLQRLGSHVACGVR